MRIGIDSYSYHRLLGERRPGEATTAERFARGSLDAVEHAREVGAELVSLETAFLPAPAAVDVEALRRAAEGAEEADSAAGARSVAARAAVGPDTAAGARRRPTKAAVGPATAAGARRRPARATVEPVIAWGHPSGLRWGADRAAEEELHAWIALAPRIGARILRLVVASPRVARPPGALAGVVPVLDRALAAARRHRVALCVENHADLTVADLEVLLDRLPGLGVCLDTANALRVGDDPVAAATALRERVTMVHLKDCAADDGGDPVAGPASLPYGTGVVDVDGVLLALGPALTGLPVCVELAQLPPGADDERALVAEAVAWLRRWRATDPPTTGGGDAWGS